MNTLSAERPGLVTGSKCTVLFPLKGDGKVGQRTYAKTLANEKFFGFSDEVETWQMAHGTMGEHFAFAHYKELIDSSIKEGQWHRKGDCGGTTDAELMYYGVDFKCPATFQQWIDYFHEGIDKQQKDQAQMYCYLTDLPAWEICPYLTETQKMTDNGLTYPVPEEKRMLRFKVEASKEWQEKLLESVPGIIKMRDDFIEALNTKFNS